MSDVMDKIQLEGLSDFSKLVEVLRAKYIDEKSFSELKTNEEKVQFCLEKEDVRSSFQSFIKTCFGNRSYEPKSGEKCQHYRQEGNKCFRGKKFQEALNFYSKALLLAPFSSDSKDLSQAFANRSAALFQLNAFAQSIEDVDNAIKFGYPPDQRPTIVLRKALSLKALGRDQEATEMLHSIQLDGLSNHANGENHDDGENHGSDYRKSLESTFRSFSLKGAESARCKFTGHLDGVKRVNPKLLSASECVKIVHSDSKGFHMKATRNIARDEALIVEKPYCSVLNVPSYEDFCNYCCQDLDKRLFPCSNCSKVSYCSESCANQAWEEYHGKECSHLEILHSSGVLRLSLRIVIKAGVGKVLEVEKESRGQNLEKMRRGCDYKSLFSLSDHSKELNYLICSRQTLAACFLTYVMASYLKLIKSDDPNYYKVAGIILKHIHQISVNSVAIFHQPIIPGPDNMFGVDVKNQVIATGLFPTVSLLNHSCISNTESFFKGNKIHVRTFRPIEVNEEIFYSYGPMFKKMTRSERMDTLQNQYYFRCSCPACDDGIIEDVENSETIRPVLTEAFLCDMCQGPTVINSGPSSKCLKCGDTSTPVPKILEQVEMSKKMANIGKALLQFGRSSETEKQYLKALETLKKVCWPTNRLILSMYNELLYCAIYMDNLQNAQKYCMESNRIKKASFGESSVEYIQGQLQVYNLKWTQQKKLDTNNSKTRTNSINKKLVTKLYQESESLIKQVKENITKNETSCGLLILDSTLVSCLKELVELEKHLRTAKQ